MSRLFFKKSLTPYITGELAFRNDRFRHSTLETKFKARYGFRVAIVGKFIPDPT
jgi:hypothetical protein